MNQDRFLDAAARAFHRFVLAHLSAPPPLAKLA